MPVLTLTNAGTISNADATTGWTGDTFVLEPDIKVEGTNSVTWQATNNGINDAYVAGSWNLTGTHLRLYISLTYMGYWAPTNAVQIWLTGGATQYITIFNSAADYKGGWYDVILDTALFNTVTLSAVTQVGLRVNTTSKPRGVINSFTDNWRYSNGTQMTSTTTEAFSLTDAAGVDAPADLSRLDGIIKLVDGILFTPGELLIGGTGAENANFVSTNETVVFPDRQVTSSLYKLKTQEGTGNTDITISGMVCKTVGTTGAEIDFSSSLNSLDVQSSAFINMGTVTLTPTVTAPVFTGNSFTDCGTTALNFEATSCNWSGSDPITLSGNGKLTNCNVSGTPLAAGSSAVLTSSLANIVGGSITSAGTGHAVELSTATGGSWTTETSGYDAGATGEPATVTEVGVDATGNETILITAASGTVNISVSGVTIPSVAKAAGSTVVVNITGFKPTLTLTGLVAGSEVRIYNAGTITEFDPGIEDSTTSYAFQYTYAANTYVDIVVHNVDYKHYRVENYLLGSGDSSLPIAQIFDRNYSNPLP